MSNIWEHNECVVLSWNKERSVFGVKVEKKGDQLHVLDTAVSSENLDSLSLGLAEVMGALNASETHLMLAGGDISSSIVFDITLPTMSIADTRQAVLYELPRHVPCDPQELVFGFRILPAASGKSATGKNLVRIVAVKKKHWNEIIAELSSAAIHVDAVLTPYLIIDPLLSEEDILFYDTEEYVSFSSSSEYHGRQIIVHDSEDDISDVSFDDFLKNIGLLQYDIKALPESIQEDPSSFFPPLLMAAYGMTPEYGNDRNSFLKLPSSLIPERYRTLRASFFGLVATIILLMLILIGRFWWEAKDRYQKITKEITNIDQLKVNTENRTKALREKAGIISEIVKKKKGIPEIATCIRAISMVLPKTMCLGSFASRDDAIDISIRYKGKGLTVPDLNQTKIMKVITMTTRINSRDNSTNVYVRLNYLPPEKRNGKN